MLGSSPKLIAAVRVFHRLPMPRHPPDALVILVLILPHIAPNESPRTDTIYPFLPYAIVNEQPALTGAKLRLDNTDNQIADTTKSRLVEVEGIEPTAFSLQS